MSLGSWMGFGIKHRSRTSDAPPSKVRRTLRAPVPTEAQMAGCAIDYRLVCELISLCNADSYGTYSDLKPCSRTTGAATPAGFPQAAEIQRNMQPTIGK